MPHEEKQRSIHKERQMFKCSQKRQRTKADVCVVVVVVVAVVVVIVVVVVVVSSLHNGEGNVECASGAPKAASCVRNAKVGEDHEAFNF